MYSMHVKKTYLFFSENYKYFKLAEVSNRKRRWDEMKLKEM